jgi:hypothetical protein
MSNWLTLGPVSLRISSKHLAPWGFPRLRIGGYEFWTWNNDGNFMPAGYHPRNSITWIWSTTLVKAPCDFRYCGSHGGPSYRTFWLPFGWRLVLSRQKPMWR